MSNAQLNVVSPSEIRLGGELTFESVPALVEEIDKLLQSGETLKLDLADVSRSDSAGLALLVSWERRALALDSRIHYLNIPEQMSGLAEVSGVEAMLALAD